MDKRKLVNIIIKDLEELKILSEEVVNSQSNSSLIVDLAVNKARLLIQEIELLRQLAVNSASFQEEPDGEDRIDEEEEEISEVSFPDPELEILHFEERDYPETEEFQEEEGEFVEQDEDEQETDVEEEEPESDDDEDEEFESDDEEPETDEDDLTEVEDEEQEEIDLEELEEEDEEEFIEEEEEEEPVQKPVIEQTELKNDPQPGIREISIDELDDEDELEPVRFTPRAESPVRPQMREIPKPEETASEKTVVGESFQKERSLNDSIGENKLESKVANSPITSLRAAIGLNDRFIFIREIFDNNSDKYNKIIENLDKMEHIQEAVEYLKANLSMQKNEASLKFVDLLKRRFTK